jgi:hypothetical protein
MDNRLTDGKISRQPPLIQTTIQQKQLENVEYFNYFGSMITKDARCTRENNK